MSDNDKLLQLWRDYRDLREIGDSGMLGGADFARSGAAHDEIIKAHAAALRDARERLNEELRRQGREFAAANDQKKGVP